jgi:ATP-dependent helicase/nuclease subunit A
LLATYPLEAGLGPQLAVDANGLATHTACQQALAAFLADPPAHLRGPWQALARQGVTVALLAQLLRELVAGGASPEDLRQWPVQEALEGLAQRVREEGQRLLPLLAVLAGEKKAKKAQELREGLAPLLASASPPSGLLAAFPQWWEKSNAGSKFRNWAKGTFTVTEEAGLGDKVQELQALAESFGGLARAAQAFDPELFAALLPVAAHLLQEVKATLARQNLVSFQDLLVKAVELLQGHPDILQRERRRIQQLLVDEFQDTDQWQARLLQLLASPGEGAPGLFVVGDPKQSIYGWRSADLAMYEAFGQWVREQGGEVLPLVRNFRSVPAILQEVQRLLRPVMKHQPGLQPPYQDLVAVREGEGFSPKPHASVEHWVLWRQEEGKKPWELSARQVRELEAEALANHVAELHHTHGVAYGQMAVLFRALSDVHLYLEAFRQRGIPTVSHRDRTYFQRREVLDALCLLRAVVEPRDQVALVGFLRSPWAGVPDAAWLPLQKAGFFPMVEKLRHKEDPHLPALEALLGQVAEELPASLPGRRRVAGWEVSTLWALACLAQARESLRQDPWDVFLHKLRQALQLEATDAARFPGRVRLQNLSRFFHFLAQAGPQLPAAQGLFRALEAAMDQVLELSPPPQPEEEEAVLFTSIHQAKGLDFDHVFLVDTHRRGQVSGKEASRAAWVGQGPQRKLALRLGPWATPNLLQLEKEEEKVAEAELVRLLYVATTRARDRLVICSPWPSSQKGGSFAELLPQREESPRLEDLWQGLGPGEDRCWAGGTLWVFPTRRQGFGQKPPRMPASPFPLEEALGQGERVAQQRVWAQEAQLRPLLAPASQEAHHKLAALWEEEGSMGEARAGGPLSGTLVHRVLEAWDFAQAPQEELEKWLGRLPGLLPPVANPEESAQAVKLAQEVLRRFAASPLFSQFCALGSAPLAREVPFLLTGDGQPAVGAYVGSMDLLYQEGQRWVVVDFKTDRVTGPELERRLEAYKAQGWRYCQGLQQAWGLPQLPAFELWFLWPGVRSRLW